MVQLREILQWLIKLLPKQKMQDNDGSGNLQAGRVEGDLHHSHTQAVYNIFMMAPDPAQTAVVSQRKRQLYRSLLQMLKTFPPSRSRDYSPNSIQQCSLAWANCTTALASQCWTLWIVSSKLEW